MLIKWQDFLALTSAHAALPLRRSAPRVAESDQRGLRCAWTPRVMVERPQALQDEDARARLPKRPYIAQDELAAAAKVA